MMLALVIAAALLTYLSRVAALGLLPPPKGALLRFVERIPAPLFAGLAALGLVGDEGGLSASGPTLWAAAAALVAAPSRSLAIVLAAGLAAYGLAVWVV